MYVLMSRTGSPRRTGKARLSPFTARCAVITVAAGGLIAGSAGIAAARTTLSASVMTSSSPVLVAPTPPPYYDTSFAPDGSDYYWPISSIPSADPTPPFCVSIGC
jgi:hypothetical protein